MKTQYILMAVAMISVMFINQTSVYALECPESPKQISKDWQAEVAVAVAKVLSAKGGELRANTNMATQDLLSKLPNADKVYLEQMMYFSYCTALRDDRTISDGEKATRLKEYSNEVRQTLSARNEKAAELQSAGKRSKKDTSKKQDKEEVKQTKQLQQQEKSRVDSNELIHIIKEKQLSNVKESYGESASQCFTDDDLNTFIKEAKPSKIANKLKQSKYFLDIVIALKKMPSTDQQDIIDRGLKTHRPTWAELQKISREGQTEAGQRAEIMIAESIIDLVRELLKLSEDDIRRLSY